MERLAGLVLVHPCTLLMTFFHTWFGNCPRGGFSGTLCLTSYVLWLPQSLTNNLVDTSRPLWQIWEMTGVREKASHLLRFTHTPFGLVSSVASTGLSCKTTRLILNKFLQFWLQVLSLLVLPVQMYKYWRISACRLWVRATDNSHEADLLRGCRFWEGDGRL